MLAGNRVRHQGEGAQAERQDGDGRKGDTSYGSLPTYIFIGLTLIGVAVAVAGGLGKANESTHVVAVDHSGKPRPKLADFVGNERAKRIVEEFAKALKLGIGTKGQGLSFEGPDGNGKRMLAKTLAGMVNGHFIELNLESLALSNVKDHEHIIKKMFRTSPENTPTILFVSRADFALPHPPEISDIQIFAGEPLTTSSTLFPWKSGRKSHAWSPSFRAQLEESNFKHLHMIISEHRKQWQRGGGANFLVVFSPVKSLPASLISGLEYQSVKFFNPDRISRKALFNNRLLHLIQDDNVREEEASKLAAASHGLSGQDVVNICHKLDRKLRLRKEDEDEEEETTTNEQEVKPSEPVQPVVEEIVVEIKPLLNEHERKIVAFHEAGHAVVSWRLENADQVRQTVSPKKRKSTISIFHFVYLPIDVRRFHCTSRGRHFGLHRIQQ
jgi:hypothetical protein